MNELNNFDTILAEVLVGIAERWAQQFITDGLKTNQVRNFFSAVAKMRQDFEKSKGDFASIRTDLVMLKPKLAYAAGRQLAVRLHFQPFMTHAIEAVSRATNQGDAVRNFFLLVESVVAYHKFYGGRDN